MGRWTQFEEDTYRLPEGMRRIEYDADTRVYTFRDRHGKIFKGEPGADYGNLTPVEAISGSVRVGAFSSDEPRNKSSANLGSTLSSFHDILPATSITAATSPVDKSKLLSSESSGQPSAARSRFINAVRRSTVPRMQGVVHDLRRSMTSARQKSSTSEESEHLLSHRFSVLSRSASRATRSGADSEEPLHRGSHNLNRSASMATARSGVSVDTPMSIKH